MTFRPAQGSRGENVGCVGSSAADVGPDYYEEQSKSPCNPSSTPLPTDLTTDLARNSQVGGDANKERRKWRQHVTKGRSDGRCFGDEIQEEVKEWKHSESQPAALSSKAWAGWLAQSPATKRNRDTAGSAESCDVGRRGDARMLVNASLLGWNLDMPQRFDASL